MFGHIRSNTCLQEHSWSEEIHLIRPEGERISVVGCSRCLISSDEILACLLHFEEENVKKKTVGLNYKK